MICRNSFRFDGSNIEVLVTIEFLRFGQKQRIHLQTIDEMLCTFINHLTQNESMNNDLN